MCRRAVAPAAGLRDEDGYALDTSEAYPLTVPTDETFPEDDPPSFEAGEAVPVATGAPLPTRATAILKREDATVEDSEFHGPS